MIVGIDLGTTHSLVGAHGPQGPQLFRNALGEVLTPSAVSVDDDGTLLVGRPALERAVSHPQASVAAFKRWMGSDRETVLGRHRLRPEELSALVLKALVADAEAATGERVTEAVISVPAYFSDGQRRATRTAGELAGIRVERLVNEPTAAALAYGLAATGREGRYLVFDLGGGTFDVSILEMFDGVMEVHASAGDNFLGGEDFLKAMHEAWLADAQLGGRKLTPSEDAQLLRRLEDAKRALVQGGEAAVQLRVADRDIAWTIDEARFAKLCDPLVQRLRAPLERAMRDAGLLPNQLDELVMVGGASRMPLAARLLARMFGQLPLRHVNPDEAIALGAAIAAGMKARDESLDEVVLTDVCPYTLGVGTSREIGSGQFVHGVFSPIIQRNSTVPVSRVETYHPIHAQQRVVEFEIFQGESPRTEHNVSLGRLSVPLPKPGIEGNAVDVRFTYDVNGVLQVEAKVQGAETVHEVVLENSPGSLTPAEIRERLARLDDIKVHPRDQQANLQVMAQAERMYAELLWAREPLQAALAEFRSVLERQEPREIERSRAAFAEMLADFEARG